MVVCEKGADHPMEVSFLEPHELEISKVSDGECVSFLLGSKVYLSDSLGSGTVATVYML